MNRPRRIAQLTHALLRLLGILLIGRLALLHETPAGLFPQPADARAQDSLRIRKPLPKFLKNATVAERYLSTRSIEEISQFELVEPVCLQLLLRSGVETHQRAEALAKLSEIRQVDTVQLIFELIERVQKTPLAGGEPSSPAISSTTPTPPPTTAHANDTSASRQVDADLAGLLVDQSREALTAHRDELQRFADRLEGGAVLEGILAGWLVADGQVDAIWDWAAPTATRHVGLLRAFRRLPGDFPRDPLATRVRPLLTTAVDPSVQSTAIVILAHLGVNGPGTFADVTQLLRQGQHTDACVEALCELPDTAWNLPDCAKLVPMLIQHIDQFPLEERANLAATRAVQLVTAIADRLPAEQATPLRQALQQVAVRALELHALEEKMAYDQTVLVVQTRQPLQLTLINGDIMPHNLVLVANAEARETVGLAADRMQTEPDALARGYLPTSDQILAATRLLQPKEQQTLALRAPAQPGTYAFLCTFPGHWSRMYGALIVTDDLAAYLASHPQMPTADEALGIRTVEWLESDLQQQITQLTTPPDFARGQKWFQRASCASCHRIQNDGGRIGPELTKIAEKHKTLPELLHHIVLPSDKIDEKYASVIVESEDGKVVRGVIVGESEKEIRIMENPLASCEPQIIAKDQIEELTRSPVSPMPEKLLNIIVEPGEVRDLVTYVFAGGDPQHPLYQGQAVGQ